MEVKMKKIIVFLALILIIGCKTQKNGQPVLDSDSSDANKPQTKIIVNNRKIVSIEYLDRKHPVLAFYCLISRNKTKII